MNEKELVHNLSKLSGFGPNEEWVKKNREVLSYQIFNGQEFAAPRVSRIAQFGFIMHRLLQPAPLAAVIALFFAISGLVGIKSSGNATPNNRVLYIAKILNEKAGLATTFDEKGKLALNVDYAQNRVTELEMISHDTDSATDPRVQELSQSFKDEIASARERWSRISPQESKETPKADINAKAVTTAPVAKITPEDTKIEQAVTKDDDNGVVTNGSLKKDTTDSVPTNTIEPSTATAVAEAEKTEDVQKILEEAEKLFNDKDYKGAADLLGSLKIK